MYKKIFLCFWLMVYSAGSTFSQNNPLISVPITSPTAASLGKFVDIPVNHYTGIPQINIPIYTVREGSLLLPISLSYHASGLKVMEQASWVGAGWALNVGGVITRSVKGQPDEQVSSSNNTSYLKNKGYYSYLFGEPQSIDSSILDYKEFVGGRKDGEPDLFFFNFNGYSGKFYFRADNTPALLPEQDILIKPLIEAGGVNELYGWIITTSDGVKYYFGKTTDISNDVDALEHTTPYSFASGITFTKVASSWYLYRIESADNEFVIDLTYEQEEYSFYALSLFPSQQGSNSGIGLVKNFVRGVRLRSIKSSNGTVDLIPETTPRQDLSYRIGFGNPLNDTDNQPNDVLTPRALKEIRILGPGNTLCRSFGFSYSYFNSSSPLISTYGGIADLSSRNLHTDKKRLKLNSLTEKSCDQSASKPPYRFTYYDESFVPRTLSLAQDHWGFYNGVSNSELIPSLSVDGGYLYSNRGANRESSWPQMRAGALKKINYPTGGSSEFVFGHGKVAVSKVTEGTIWLSQFDVSARGNSLGTSTSPKHVIVVTGETKIYKVKVEYFGGGTGTVFLGTHQFGAGEHKVALAAGNHEWYAQVSGSSSLNSGQGVMGKIAVVDRVHRASNVPIGGLRVEQITFQNSKSETALVTTYRYKDWRGNDEPTLYSRPNYISLVRNDRNKESGIFMGPMSANRSDGCIEFDGAGKRAYFVSPSSIHPLQTTQGYHLGYTQVDVIHPGGGHTQYQYHQDQNPSTLDDVSVRSIKENECSLDAPNYPPKPENSDFSRGELRSTAVYDVTGKLLRESHYETEYIYEQNGTHGLLVSPYNSYYLASEYELKTARKTKTTALDLSYDALNRDKMPVGSLTETFYSSPHHNLPVKSTTFSITGFTSAEKKILTAIKGEVISETRKTYAGDIRLPSCEEENECIQSRLDKEEQAFTEYSNCSSYECTTGGNACENAFCHTEAWVTYIKAVNKARIEWVSCQVIYSIDYQRCAGKSAIYLAASPELKAVLDLKKSYRLAEVLETTQWRDNKLLSGSYITYGQSGSDRRSIVPVQQDLLSTDSPLPPTDYDAVSNTDNAIDKDDRYLPEYTYRFENANPVEIIGRDGVVTAYIWGHDNTLPVVKATGVSYAILHPAYQAVNGDLAVLRQRAELQNALITTYNYDALGALTSQTDPNGRTTHYVYDGLGRQKQILDNEGNIMRHLDYQYKR